MFILTLANQAMTAERSAEHVGRVLTVRLAAHGVVAEVADAGVAGLEGVSCGGLRLVHIE